MWDLIVVGGGAAGMAGAIAAADCGDRVLLLERMDRVGKKLLATGNGRCNLMNRGAPRYRDNPLAAQMLKRYGAAQQEAFWHSLGLMLYTDREDRVYPASLQASTVLDVLRGAMEERHICVRTDSAVTGLKRTPQGFAVMCAKGECYQGARVLITTGGLAQPKLGSDGSGFPLLESVGHAVTELRPGLTQVMTDTEPIRGLEGIRVRGIVRAYAHDRLLGEEQGEILFASYGLSGICVMQLSAACDGKDRSVSLDLSYGLGLSPEALREEISRRGALPAERLLCGMFVPRLQQALFRKAGIPMGGKPLSASERDRLWRTICDFRLPVRGLRGFESAQVTRGGAETGLFDPHTLESRKVPGLYAAGEVLDVDGDCGGYNLMFAFGSGLMAGSRGRNMRGEILYADR